MSNNSNDSKHTPTPWKQKDTFPNWVTDANDQLICKCGSILHPDKATAALIVRAVNNLETNEKRIEELEEAYDLVILSASKMKDALEIAKNYVVFAKQNGGIGEIDSDLIKINKALALTQATKKP